MPIHRRILLAGPLLAAALYTAAPGWSQARNNEVGLLAGFVSTPSLSDQETPQQRDLSFNKALAFSAEYSRVIARSPLSELQVGFSLSASPLDVKIGNGPTSARKEYAFLFVTPEVKLKFAPRAPLSPWLSVGGGLANYDESAKLLDGTSTPSQKGNHKALTLAGGVDLRTPVRLLVPVGLRLEARDYYAGKPDLNVYTGGGYSNNVIVSGGLLFRF